MAFSKTAEASCFTQMEKLWCRQETTEFHHIQILLYKVCNTSGSNFLVMYKSNEIEIAEQMEKRDHPRDFQET